jgi:hypothetical protein
MKVKKHDALVFTHVTSVKNTKELQKHPSYSPAWLIPELPKGDPLYGLDLRVVISHWQELYRKLQIKLKEREDELAELKKKSWRNWFKNTLHTSGQPMPNITKKKLNPWDRAKKLTLLRTSPAASTASTSIGV